MNITFTLQPTPELTIDDGTLAGLGFTPSTPLQLTLRADGMWITIVTDAATWNALCDILPEADLNAACSGPARGEAQG